jgi:hypothetical protein
LFFNSIYFTIFIDISLRFNPRTLYAQTERGKMDQIIVLADQIKEESERELTSVQRDKLCDMALQLTALLSAQ